MKHEKNTHMYLSGPSPRLYHNYTSLGAKRVRRYCSAAQSCCPCRNVISYSFVFHCMRKQSVAWERVKSVRVSRSKNDFTFHVDEARTTGRLYRQLVIGWVHWWLFIWQVFFNLIWSNLLCCNSFNSVRRLCVQRVCGQQRACMKCLNMFTVISRRTTTRDSSSCV